VNNTSIAYEVLNSHTESEPPCFVQVGPGYYDGWNPPNEARNPSYPDLEALTGEIYADLAVSHARRVGQHAFISMVLAAIFYKTTHGQIQMGALERGFITRIGQLSYLGSLN
jgi:hypothetical protein